MFFGVVVKVSIQGSNDKTNRPQAIADIWEDLPVLQKLQHGTFPSSTSAMKINRIGHRITRFHWEDGLLFRLWTDGTRYIIPRPDQRASLVQQVHEELGHFGIYKTHLMLRGQYWWTSMYKHVAAYVGKCEVSDLVKSSFNTLSP